MRTVVIIQARMGSTRLPGKVLMDLGGKPVLAHVVERCKASGFPVVVATTTNDEDGAICDWCETNSVDYFRGNECPQRRIADCAERFCADVIVRVCGDSPRLESDSICNLVQAIWDGADYAAYRFDSGKPCILSKLGLTCEALTRYCLSEEVANTSNIRHEIREHVTAGIYSIPSRWAIRWVPLNVRWFNLCDVHEEVRTAIDTQEDLDRAREQLAVTV